MNIINLIIWIVIIGFGMYLQNRYAPIAAVAKDILNFIGIILMILALFQFAGKVHSFPVIVNN